MLAKNYSDARNNFKSLCDTIIQDEETIIVTRKNEENIVMMSLDEYNNLMENMHIRQSANTYNRILKARVQVQDGSGIERTMEELETMEHE